MLISLFGGLWGGCATLGSQRVPEDPRPLLPLVGEAPSVQVALSKEADEKQRKACAEAVAAQGIAAQAEAQVTATVDLGQEPKVLTVTSRSKGQVLREERPSWWIDDLCRDALAAALRALAVERGQKVPPTRAEIEAQEAREAKAEEAKREREAQAEEARQQRAQRRARRDAPKTPASPAEPAKKGGKDPWADL